MNFVIYISSLLSNCTSFTEIENFYSNLDMGNRSLVSLNTKKSSICESMNFLRCLNLLMLFLKVLILIKTIKWYFSYNKMLDIGDRLLEPQILIHIPFAKIWPWIISFLKYLLINNQKLIFIKIYNLFSSFQLIFSPAGEVTRVDNIICYVKYWYEEDYCYWYGAFCVLDI